MSLHDRIGQRDRLRPNLSSARVMPSNAPCARLPVPRSQQPRGLNPTSFSPPFSFCHPSSSCPSFSSCHRALPFYLICRFSFCLSSSSLYPPSSSPSDPSSCLFPLSSCLFPLSSCPSRLSSCLFQR